MKSRVFEFGRGRGNAGAVPHVTRPLSGEVERMAPADADRAWLFETTLWCFLIVCGLAVGLVVGHGARDYATWETGYASGVEDAVANGCKEESR